MANRVFTADEANALLGEVRPLAERLVAGARALAEAERRRAALAARIAGNGGDLAPSDLGEAAGAVEDAAGEVSEALRALDELGVEVKDVGTGLLDFPARRGGEDVLLCWRLGEPEVAWWHRRDDGFAGRRPLSEL